MTSLAHFADTLSPIVHYLGDVDFAQHLVTALKQLVAADDGSVLLYDADRLPDIIFTQPVAGRERTTLDAYLKGPFLLDPFYRAAAYDQRFGVFRLAELAPIGFKDSEYYRVWYRNSGYEDECGLLIGLGQQRFLNIALGLTGTSGRFGKRQAGLLRDAYPMIAALCQKHWRSEKRPTTTEGLRTQLHASLAAFGASLLTRRERQVTELVLLGNSTRVIAEKLGISTETVKLHRKHAYAKLDVSSQAELFYLFMEALAHSAGDPDIDPLIAYHSKPGQ